MFHGNEIFRVQKAIYKKIAGIFGLSEAKRTNMAIALDAAVIFGILKERHDQKKVPTEMLKTMLRNKIARLGGDVEGIDFYDDGK